MQRLLKCSVICFILILLRYPICAESYEVVDRPVGPDYVYARYTTKEGTGNKIYNFDVSVKNYLAIVVEYWPSNARFCVYDPAGEFCYGYTISRSGGPCYVQWKEDNLLIWGGAYYWEYDSQGNLLQFADVIFENDTQERNHFYALKSNRKEVNGIEYVMKYHNKIIRTNSSGDSEVIYDITWRNVGRRAFIFGIFAVIALRSVRYFLRLVKEALKHN